jgi:hypothetical protein
LSKRACSVIVARLTVGLSPDFTSFSFVFITFVVLRAPPHIAMAGQGCFGLSALLLEEPLRTG